MPALGPGPVLATEAEVRVLSKYPKAALIDLAVSLAGRCDDSQRFSVLCEELEAVRAARGSR